MEDFTYFRAWQKILKATEGGAGGVVLLFGSLLRPCPLKENTVSFSLCPEKRVQNDPESPLCALCVVAKNTKDGRAFAKMRKV